MSKAKPFLGKREAVADTSAALLYQRYLSVDEIVKAAKSDKAVEGGKSEDAGPSHTAEGSKKKDKKGKKRQAEAPADAELEPAVKEIEPTTAATAFAAEVPIPVAAVDAGGVPQEDEAPKRKERKKPRWRDRMPHQVAAAVAALEGASTDGAATAGVVASSEQPAPQQQQQQQPGSADTPAAAAAVAGQSGANAGAIEAAVTTTPVGYAAPGELSGNLAEAQQIRAVLGYAPAADSVAGPSCSTAEQANGTSKSNSKKSKKEKAGKGAESHVPAAAPAPASLGGVGGKGGKAFSFAFSIVAAQAEAADEAKLARLMALDVSKDGFVPRRVWVCGMPHEWSEDDIKDYWAFCGEVEEMECLTFRDSGRFNGVCFITFKTQVGYEAALGCAGEECEGRTLRVEKCKAATEVRRKEREGRLITKPAAGTTPSNGGPDGTDGAGGTEGTTASGPGRVAGYNVAYVGNIAFEVTAEEVLRFFAAGGAVPTKVRLHTDKVTGRSKGFAHVHFADDAALESALAMDGRALGSRQLRVSYAQPKKEGVHQGGAAATGVGGAEQM